MKVSLKKAFSILDGRLSTEIDEVYKMLNFIFDENFMTHQLPTAMDVLVKENPEWFKKGVVIIANIKLTNKTNDFKELMKLIDEGFSTHKLKLGKIKPKIGFLSGLFSK